MALTIVSGLPPGLKTVSQSQREQHKRYQKIPKEDEIVALGSLARESTNFISDFGSQVQTAYSCFITANSRVNPIALQAFGTIACLNFPLGVIAAKEAHSEALTHRKVNNFSAECTAWLKCVTGALQAAAGALYLPAQALTIVLFYAASKAVVIAASVLGGASMTLFGGASLLFGISTSLDLHKEVSLRQDLNKILSQSNVQDKNHQALLFLKQRIETGGKLEMVRLTGSKSAEAILTADATNAAEVVQLVLQENNKAIALSATVAVLMLVGVALSGLSIAFSGGTAALVIALLGAAVGLAWLGLDGYNFIKAAQEGEKGKYDRLWLLFTTLVCGLATGATLCLTQGAALLFF